MSEKKRRVELSMKEKLEIIAACEGPQKQSFAAVAKKFNIDRSTVSKIYKRREVITQLASSSNISRKRQRSSKVEGVDEALYRWFVNAIETDLPITGEILRTKAGNIANELGLESFLASKGWLDRWKKRYGVLYKKGHGEKINFDVKTADLWLSTRLSDVLHRYEPSDIFNAVETALYWRALPDGSSISREGQPSDSEMAQDRLTVLACVSMTGEKCPLLVIGKSKTPHCFLTVKNPPVHYKQDSNAGMTSAIFQNWLCAWDKELELHKRKIALIVDNYAADRRLEFKCIELVFWPPNIIPLIQPCHQGIICALKAYYRHLIIRRLLATIESSDQDISPLQLIQKIDLLSSVRLLKESWDMVTDDTIVNSFRKAKFYKDSTNISSLENDMFTFNKEEIDFESFVDVNQHIECVESLNEMEPEPEETGLSIKIKEEPDSEIPEITVTKATALECLQLLQTFLSNEGVQDWEHFNKLEAQVQNIILKKP